MGQDASDYIGHFQNYAEYSKTFRSTMVAYGVGGPVLFFIGKDAPAAVAGSPYAAVIVTLFVLGVALQIFLALINKWAAWHMYRGAFSMYQDATQDSECDFHHKSAAYKYWAIINKQSWIDFVVDVTALLSFAIATGLVLAAVIVELKAS